MGRQGPWRGAVREAGSRDHGVVREAGSRDHGVVREAGSWGRGAENESVGSDGCFGFI